MAPKKDFWGEDIEDLAKNDDSSTANAEQYSDDEQPDNHDNDPLPASHLTKEAPASNKMDKGKGKAKSEEELDEDYDMGAKKDKGKGKAVSEDLSEDLHDEVNMKGDRYSYLDALPEKLQQFADSLPNTQHQEPSQQYEEPQSDTAGYEELYQHTQEEEDDLAQAIRNSLQDFYSEQPGQPTLYNMGASSSRSQQPHQEESFAALPGNHPVDITEEEGGPGEAEVPEPFDYHEY